MKNIDTLEQRMNSEHRWIEMNNYFQLLISERQGGVSINEEINLHLKKIAHITLDKSIDWQKEQEINELTFSEFCYSKFTHSMAYSDKLMTGEKAIAYLSEFVGYFWKNKQFFTNYDDLNDIIKNFGTIAKYESKGGYSYGCKDISKNVFSCALIIIDSENIGAIVIRDDD